MSVTLVNYMAMADGGRRKWRWDRALVVVGVLLILTGIVTIVLLAR